MSAWVITAPVDEPWAGATVGAVTMHYVRGDSLSGTSIAGETEIPTVTTRS